MSLLDFLHYQIHPTVSEYAPVHFSVLLMDANPVMDVPDLCLSGHLLVPSVFHPMAVVSLEFPALILIENAPVRIVDALVESLDMG